MKENSTLWAGLDIGSTTVKIAVIDPESRELLFSEYRRHNANQAACALEILKDTHRRFKDTDIELAVCGSGGLPVSKAIGAHFIQEVVANSIAIRTFHQNAQVAIELGGQDAKVIFFRKDNATGQLVASDMRMNGSCAGGTGAFIDQVAELLSVKTEEFGGLASQGKTVYDISGRCGVFAKTDIQPLLNQGVSKEDIALSSFHAIAKQTIGGLAQGMDINPPVIFEGGPLTFNPRLIEVFKERLMLTDNDIIIPEKPEIIIAFGAALSIGTMFSDHENAFSWEKSLQDLENYLETRKTESAKSADDFFGNEKEKTDFFKRHPLPDFEKPEFPEGSELDVYIGIDAGSTTSKFVLIDENENIIDRYYSNNHGDPLRVIKYALMQMRDEYKERGIKLRIKGVGTTGYGEVLFSKAFHADYHTVETVAHAEAAQKYAPGATFILDIGGQDMKAISLKGDIVTGIVLNEACSAGCGSFVETYARSLGIPVDKIAEMAFAAESPSRLGSRCTVFMNSSIITEQKNGKSTGDILAGVCRSIIENVFTKVVRMSNLDALGDTVVVQGGTFKNNAVLRAFEQYTGRTPVRPPFPGEMGAIGIALLTKKHIQERPAPYMSSFIGLDSLEDFEYSKEPGLICNFCQNNCNRTLVSFSDGGKYITGNRCEKGEILGDIKDPEVRKQLTETASRIKSVPNMIQRHNELLTANYKPAQILPKQNIKIGIPRALEFWASLPFWKTLFESLGFDVVISKKSNYALFDSGLQSVPSDTICFPAKLVHGHIKDLIAKNVDRVFMPMMVRIPKENKSAESTHVCTVVQGYPMVAAKSDDVERKYGVPFDHPVFHWENHSMRHKQTTTWLKETFGISKQDAKKALKEADKALMSFRKQQQDEGRKIIEQVRRENSFAVVLAGRPYHSDELVNHDLSSHFTRLGIPVLSLDSLPDLHFQPLKNVRMETTIPFHARMLGAALAAADNPYLEIVQIVSFGCGHDAIISDEMIRIMQQKSNKELLVLKLDEGEAKGPLNIRIKSFIETIKVKRRQQKPKKLLPIDLPINLPIDLPTPFERIFHKEDKKKRYILAPNLSPAFSKLIAAVFRKEGFKVYNLPLADARAIELGKKYVHNDICYPAQLNIGEALAAIERGDVKPEEATMGLAKNCEDCRAGQYATLARKALDEAGYPDIPIVTTGTDTKNMHPGLRLTMGFSLRMALGLLLVDGLELMRRTTRPYEINKGETENVFSIFLQKINDGIEINNKRALEAFEEAVQEFNQIPVDRSVRRPRVGLVGEILLNYHPVSNCNTENYLESHGMEVVIPPMLDFFRRSYVQDKNKASRNLLPNSFLSFMVAELSDRVIRSMKKRTDDILENFRFLDHLSDINELITHIEDEIDVTYSAGEGWLMPAEIINMAKHGVNSFVILNPFGCLPNHITGRGMIKSLKERFPHIQILSLDFDPDTSFANVENRLQMLIITAKELEEARKNAEPVR